MEVPRTLCKLCGQSRLAHSGLAAKGDEATRAAMGREQGVFENEELLIPSHERGAEGALQHASIVPSAWRSREGFSAGQLLWQASICPIPRTSGTRSRIPGRVRTQCCRMAVFRHPAGSECGPTV